MEHDYFRDITFGIPEKIDKTWGYELIIANTKFYCGKILHYNTKGAVSSFHFHPEKKESFFCLQGQFLFQYKNDRGFNLSRYLSPGQIIHIPNCRPHQLKCLEDNSEIFEVSTYHSNLDVIRIEPGDSQK